MHIGLSILHFLDCLRLKGVRLALGDKIPEVELSVCESEKEKVALKGFFELYYKFLRIQNEKPFQYPFYEQINTEIINYC